MDPDEALRQIREQVKEILDEGHAGHDATALAELVNGLDEWLTKDGFLPFDWQSEEDKAEQRMIEARRADPITWPAFQPGPRQEG